MSAWPLLYLQPQACWLLDEHAATLPFYSMPAPNDPDKRLTNALFLLGSAALAFLPLYITRFRGAIDDGALLLIGSVLAADALFRCLNPLNKRTNWGVLFGVGAAVSWA